MCVQQLFKKKKMTIKCLNTSAKLIIQQLYESMFHEPYMLTEGSHAKINNNPAFMPVVI